MSCSSEALSKTRISCSRCNSLSQWDPFPVSESHDKTNPKVNEELRKKLPTPNQHLYTELKKSKVIASFEDFCKELRLLGKSSEVLEQDAESLPDQTSSQIQMEAWSKEMSDVEQDSEQEQGDPLASDLPCQSRSVTMQRRRERTTPAGREQTEPPRPPASGLRCLQTASSQVSQLNIGAAFCPDGKSSSTEKEGGKVKPDLMNSCHVTADIGREKDIVLLLKELDILRSHNKKLQDNLLEKDKELKALKLDSELHERATEARIAEQAAALVEEIHSAQREHDEAIRARLKLANDERDDARKRGKEMEQIFETLENINPEENDMTLQELLNRINNADTSMAIRRSGAIIVDRIYRTQERKKKIIAEEMNAVIEERDAALAQCKRLEQELHHMKEQNQTSANNTRHLTAENNQERALKGKLLAMQQEREVAVQQYKQVQEEIQTLRVYYSLHQSLSQEQNLKDQFNSTLMTYEKALKNREEIVSLLLLQNEELTTQVQQAWEERANTELKFQQALATSQEASDKLQKLQRLVDVLRKKVGAGAVRTVI